LLKGSTWSRIYYPLLKKHPGTLQKTGCKESADGYRKIGTRQFAVAYELILNDI